jgi:methylated-DNA-protein-cysteine methyltransferase related protein
VAESSDFFERVYHLVRQIPPGRVTSYGAIARAVGAAKAARTVGYAMNASHQLPDIPAHRVVNRQGLLTGKHHFGGNTAMQQLLESEGVQILEDQIQDFAAHYWDPLLEGADLPDTL